MSSIQLNIVASPETVQPAAVPPGQVPQAPVPPAQGPPAAVTPPLSPTPQTNAPTAPGSAPINQSPTSAMQSTIPGGSGFRAFVDTVAAGFSNVGALLGGILNK